MAKRPPKQTYYQRSEAYAKQVSGEIIEQIKKGTAPWQKPWKPGKQSSPSNIATGKAYTGGNSLYLMSRQISEGRGDNRWGTYRQGCREFVRRRSRCNGTGVHRSDRHGWCYRADGSRRSDSERRRSRMRTLHACCA